MYKRLNVRLYPTVKQKQMLELHFNGYRFAYNLCLEYKSLMWKYHKINKSGYDMRKELYEIRKETAWLKKCKAECVGQAALNLDNAFESFFSGYAYPKFKSKNGEQSFFASQSIKVIANRIKFYGNKIKFKTSDRYSKILESEIIKSVTFKKERTGKYIASILIYKDHINNKPTIAQNSIIGIDLGLKDLVITSDGVVYPNNHFLINTLNKIKRIKRKFSKAKKGGRNKERLRLKIAKHYKKAFNQKEHYYHQITNELIRNNQTIVMETIGIQNLMKNRKVSKHILDASWGSLVYMLEYKSIWNDRIIIKIDRWYPSSKTCSDCGNLKETLLLSERTYNCEICGLSIDRDINAAINIRNEGLRIPGLSVEGKVTNPKKQKVTV